MCRRLCCRFVPSGKNRRGGTKPLKIISVSRSCQGLFLTVRWVAFMLFDSVNLQFAAPTIWRFQMARVCQVSGKRRMVGNNVSHSQRKTKRVQRPNLIKKRIYLPEEGRSVTLTLSARSLRTMNKKGVQQVLKEAGVKI